MAKVANTFIKKISSEEFTILNLKYRRCDGQLEQFIIKASPTLIESKVVLRGVYVENGDDSFVDVTVVDIFVYERNYYVITDKNQLLKLKKGQGKPTLIKQRLDDVRAALQDGEI